MQKKRAIRERTPYKNNLCRACAAGMAPSLAIQLAQQSTSCASTATVTFLLADRPAREGVLCQLRKHFHIRLVFDGRENVVTMGLRDHSDALRLLGRTPSRDWHTIDVSGLSEIKLASDPIGSVSTRLTRQLIAIRNTMGTGGSLEGYLAPDQDRHLKILPGNTPNFGEGPTDLNCKVVNIRVEAGTTFADHELTWTWERSGETSFEVSVATDDGGPFSAAAEVGAGEFKMNVARVPLVETHFYRVRACREDAATGGNRICSDFSNIAACIGMGPQPPAAPTELRCVEVKEREIKLQWKDFALHSSIGSLPPELDDCPCN